MPKVSILIQPITGVLENMVVIAQYLQINHLTHFSPIPPENVRKRLVI